MGKRLNDFTDLRRSKLTYTTLGEHKKYMETVADQPWRHMDALSTRIRLCRINRAVGQGKFTRISDKTLIAWERKAEQMQRDIYERGKHLHNGQRLWEQGYKQVKKGEITEWVKGDDDDWPMQA